MKNVLDMLIQKVYAADNPDAICLSTEDWYSDCCLQKGLKINTTKTALAGAERSGSKDQVSSLTAELTNLEKNYRNECPTFAEAGIEATDSSVCEAQYGDFFVEVGEGVNADICYCDDQLTSEKEKIDCREIPTENFAQTCEEKGWISRGTSCEVCAFGVTADGKECVANTQGTLGIECGDPTKPCSLNTTALFGTAGVSSDTQTKTLLVWFQDVTLAATGFIGTVLTISFIVVALRYITGGVDQTYVGNAKKAFRYGIIGFFLVAFSYTIIRLVQFLAKGG